MKKMHSFIKHLIAILLGTALVGMSVYAVQIPTSLNNALQYIMETIWTSDGTSSGTTNVRVWTGGIYIATGFLSNGNAWNNMSLGVDGSGNVVYVPGSSSTPIFSLASNFIPKLDALGSALEISVMYQTGGLIGVNKTNPTRSVNILGDFLVETQGLNVTYQYNFVNSNTGLGYPPVDIGTAPRCSCDINANAADCSSPSFASVNDQGFYCVDLTVQNNGNYYDHNVYTRQTIGIPSPVLSTSGANVGVRTDNPQAALHVSGDVRIDTIPVGNASWQVLVQNPVTNIISRISPSLLGGTGVTQTLSLAGWALSILNGNTVILPTPTLSIVGNTLTISGSTQNSVALPTPTPQTLSLVGNTLSISSGNSVILPTIGGSNGWNLTGNAGTNPATNFLGTTDNQGLSIKVNNTEIHRYYTNGSIVGGLSHTYTNGSYSIIGGGSGNNLSGDYATIGGGGMNYALGYGSVVGGGYANATTGTTSTIAGGTSNYAPGDDSFIGGGSMNAARGYRSTVGGGRQNQATGDYTSIAGGLTNIVSGLYSFIGGGVSNVVHSIGSVIAGGSNNIILSNSNGSVIVGGSGNKIDGQGGSNSFIGGGTNNTGSWALAVVVGGSSNQATQNSFVGGGIGNRAIGNPILFGPSNVVVGGNFNTVQGLAGFVGGGVGNIVLGDYTTIPGGSQNTGAGDYSFAAGQYAVASGNNSFVWSDGDLTQNSNIYNNEFRVSSDRILLGRHTPMLDWAIQAYTGANFDIGLLGTTVADTLRVDNSLIQNLTVTSSYFGPSDSRLKTNINPGTSRGTSALNILNNLNPVTYQWADNSLTAGFGFDHDKLHYGFIAQEVETVLPDLVMVNSQLSSLAKGLEGGGIKALNMNEIIPILTQAIKEQQVIINDLTARIEALETP